MPESSDNKLAIFESLFTPHMIRGWKRFIGRLYRHRLCEQCSKIDFSVIFGDSIELQAANGVLLADLGHVKPRQHALKRRCRLCSFFRASTVFWSEDIQHELRAISSARILVCQDQKARQVLPETLGKTSVVLQVFSVSNRDSTLGGLVDPLEWRLDHGKKILLEQPAHSKQPTDLEIVGRSHRPGQIRFDKLKNLIDQCSLTHEMCRTKRRSTSDLLVSGMEVLDCLNYQLITHRGQNDYLALSYVWGQEQSQNHLRKALASGKFQNLPRTIRDAMLISKHLGYRYLWVDALCIDNHDHASKNYQIRHMDRIHEGAVAVLIATGPHADAGIAGISVVRKKQATVSMDFGNLVESMHGLRDAMENSKWMTRAWTYQEAMLAQRCLFFTDEQVHFACSSLIAQETMDYSSYPNTLVLGPSLLSFYHTRYVDDVKDMVDSEIRDLVEHIQNYSTRTWTLRSDSLNALQGILERSTIDNLRGVPLLGPRNRESSSQIGTASDSLARGLLWSSLDGHGLIGSNAINDFVYDELPSDRSLQNTRNLTEEVSQRMRAYEAPSWSWASLPDYIKFEENLLFSMTSISAETLQIEIPDTGEKWRCIEETESLRHNNTSAIRIKSLVWRRFFEYNWIEEDGLIADIDLQRLYPGTVPDLEGLEDESGHSGCWLCPCISRDQLHTIHAVLLQDTGQTYWLLYAMDNGIAMRVGMASCSIPWLRLGQDVTLETVEIH